MELTTEQVASVVGGRVAGPSVVVRGAETDSRQVRGGELFVPLRAERDGHDFIAAALAAGVGAYLTSRLPGPGSAVVVEDVPEAFDRLASHARDVIGADVVGITGSVGKTTTKDLVAVLLSTDRRVHASRKSFNNAIGVPYTMVNAPAGTEALVLEMGANAPGEIQQLCALARPTIGVVTRVAPAHTLGFGGIEGVAAAKAELVVALPAGGVAVLNADDPRVAAMARRTDAKVVTFGSYEAADVHFEVTELGPELRPRVRFSTPWGTLATVLSVRGAHQAYNAAAAVAVAGVLGVAPDLMAAALADAPVSGQRMDLRTAANGLRVLDDSYNASPVAVEAALQALAQAPARRRVAVLGTMAELGELSEAEHRRVAQVAAGLGIEVLAVAAPQYGVVTLPDLGAVLEQLRDLGDGDIVLVKGSREAHLEAVADALLSGPQ